MRYGMLRYTTTPGSPRSGVEVALVTGIYQVSDLSPATPGSPPLPEGVMSAIETADSHIFARESVESLIEQYDSKINKNG